MEPLSQAGTTTDFVHKKGEAPRPLATAIRLQKLSPHDPLCHKWQLGAGLPPATEKHWLEHEASHKTEPADNGRLRLCSRPESGEPWECHVAFADLAREGGMIVGQCPHTADIVLPHDNVSNHHALLEIAESGLVITALCAANGTYVNEQELTPYDRRVPLMDGMDIILGDASLQLEYIL